MPIKNKKKEWAFCRVALAALKKNPSHTSEIETQLLFGETVEILQHEKDYWVLVQSTAYDQYKGYCLIGQLQKISKIKSNLNNTYIAQGHHNKLILDWGELPIPQAAIWDNSLLKIDDTKAKFKGKKEKINTLTANETNILNAAMSYLGAPYLWGGRSIMGIDCSGLSQMVMRLNGINLPRNASQQALEGETIAFLQEAKCGDLAFFENEEGRINHVGILLNSKEIIHATETSARVVVDKIDQEGIISLYLKKRTHNLRIIKRFF